MIWTEKHRRVGRYKYKVLHLARNNQLHKLKMESEWLCSSSGKRPVSYGRSQSWHGSIHAVVKRANGKLVSTNKCVTYTMWSFSCSQLLLARLHVANRVLRNYNYLGEQGNFQGRRIRKKKPKKLGIFKEKKTEWKCTDGYIKEWSILFCVFLLEKPSKKIFLNHWNRLQESLWNFEECDELGITDPDLGQKKGFMPCLWGAFQHWNSIVWPLLGLPGKSKYFLHKHIFFITKKIDFGNSSAALLQLEIMHTCSLLSTYTWNEPFPNPPIFGLLQHSQTTKNFAVPLQIKSQCQRILYSLFGIHLVEKRNTSKMSPNGKHIGWKYLISYPNCFISVIYLDINTDKKSSFHFEKKEVLMFKEGPEVYFKHSLLTYFLLMSFDFVVEWTFLYTW